MAYAGSFSWVSEVTTVAMNVPILYIKNNSADHALAISTVSFGSSVPNKFTLCQVSGAASGTVLDGVNHEEGSRRETTVELATSFGNAPVTGLTKGASLLVQRCRANGVSQRMFIEDRMIDELIYVRPGRDVAVYAARVGDIEVCLCGTWI